MVTPTLRSNVGDQKVCKKKNLSWLFGTDRKICPSGSLFGINRRSLMMPNSRAAAIYRNIGILQYGPKQYAILYWKHSVCHIAIWSTDT